VSFGCDNLFFNPHDAKHFCSAGAAGTGHGHPGFSTLPFHGNFFWVLHVPLGFAFYAISFCWHVAFAPPIFNFSGAKSY